MTKHSPFRYFKSSPEIIRLAVMLYVRFPLSLRNVEDLLHERAVGAGITRFATVAKYNARIRRPRLFGAAVLGVLSDKTRLRRAGWSRSLSV